MMMMLLAKVKGHIIATRKCQNLVGYKLLTVEVMNEQNQIMVVADQLGAGVGETVIVSRGSAVQYGLDKEVPIDALVIGIVDNEPEF